MRIVEIIEQESSPRRDSEASPRIAIAAEPRYLAQPQPGGLARALEAWGCRAAILDPQDPAGPALAGFDLLVARGRSPAVLALLGRAESMGIATVNRRAAIAAVLDKASMARALASARIPAPPTRTGTLGAIARASRSADFPLVVKPVFGDNARGVRVVRSRAELADLPWDEATALAQPLVPSDGFDLKLYVAGAEVRAVRKPSPIAPPSGAPARPVDVTPELRTLALRCGRLFGLELFGVDCIATPRGPSVIEVNDFPNYSGVNGAGDLLARFVLGRARRQASRGRRA